MRVGNLLLVDLEFGAEEAEANLFHNLYSETRFHSGQLTADNGDFHDGIGQWNAVVSHRLADSADRKTNSSKNDPDSPFIKRKTHRIINKQSAFKEQKASTKEKNQIEVFIPRVAISRSKSQQVEQTLDSPQKKEDELLPCYLKTQCKRPHFPISSRYQDLQEFKEVSEDKKKTFRQRRTQSNSDISYVPQASVSIAVKETPSGPLPTKVSAFKTSEKKLEIRLQKPSKTRRPMFNLPFSDRAKHPTPMTPMQQLQTQLDLQHSHPCPTPSASPPLLAKHSPPPPLTLTISSPTQQPISCLINHYQQIFTGGHKPLLSHHHRPATTVHSSTEVRRVWGSDSKEISGERSARIMKGLGSETNIDQVMSVAHLPTNIGNFCTSNKQFLKEFVKEFYQRNLELPNNRNTMKSAKKLNFDIAEVNSGTSQAKLSENQHNRPSNESRNDNYDSLLLETPDKHQSKQRIAVGSSSGSRSNNLMQQEIKLIRDHKGKTFRFPTYIAIDQNCKSSGYLNKEKWQIDTSLKSSSRADQIADKLKSNLGAAEAMQEPLVRKSSPTSRIVGSQMFKRSRPIDTTEATAFETSINKNQLQQHQNQGSTEPGLTNRQSTLSKDKKVSNCTYFAYKSNHRNTKSCTALLFPDKNSLRP